MCASVFNTNGSKSIVIEISGLYIKSFGDLAKVCYFLRFHNGSGNVLVNGENCLFL